MARYIAIASLVFITLASCSKKKLEKSFNSGDPGKTPTPEETQTPSPSPVATVTNTPSPMPTETESPGNPNVQPTATATPTSSQSLSVTGFQGVAHISAPSANRLKITWNAEVSGNSDRYLVSVSTTQGIHDFLSPTKVVADVTQTSTIVSELPNGTQYFVMVRASNGTLADSNSNELSASTLALPWQGSEFPGPLARSNFADFLNFTKDVLAPGEVTTLTGRQEPSVTYRSVPHQTLPGGSYSLTNPLGVTLDTAGNVFVFDYEGQRVLKVDRNNYKNVSRLAGTGTTGSLGLEGPATSALLNGPRAGVIDGDGNLIFPEYGNNRVVKVDTLGTISLVAGTGAAGFSGDGGAATAAQLNNPTAVAIDSNGAIYVADFNNHRIRKIAGGTISTYAGTGVGDYSGDGAAATAANLKQPASLVFDSTGTLIFSDYGNRRIRKIHNDGTISLVAGNGTAGYLGDGGMATSASFNGPGAVGISDQGEIYVGDTFNHRIRKISTDGVISLFAGNGSAGYSGDSGDSGPATSASLFYPNNQITVDSRGFVFFPDQGNNLIRVISSIGIIETLMGYTSSLGHSGDNSAASTAKLKYPFGIRLTTEASLYIADYQNHRVRKINSDGSMTVIIGTGTASSTGDGGTATAATVNWPIDVAIDSQGSLYVSEYFGHRIRKISTNGIVSTFAGTGDPGFADDVAATAAQLNAPRGIIFDLEGNLLIADYSNKRIRKVSTAGVMSTFAGNGTSGSAGDGAQATLAQLGGPNAFAINPNGEIVFTDLVNQSIRKISTDGVISKIAGTGVAGFSGDGGPATSANLNLPVTPVFDSLGNIYFTDFSNHRIRRIRTDGSISTILGNGYAGSSGDGEPGNMATSNLPSGLAIDSQGSLYFSEYGGHRIRFIKGHIP